VIDADVAPAGICTRREFATWLMAFSEKLSASPTDRVYPAMFIEGISEQAYADVAPDDQDFAAIQGLAEAGILPSLLGRKDEAGGAAEGEGAGEGEALFRPDSPLTRQDLLTWRFALEYSHLPPPDLAALRHTCGLIDAARISPAAQRAVSFDFLHHRGGMEHQPEGEEEGWGQAGGKGLGEGQGRGQDFKSATNAAVIPLVFGNVRRFDPLKPVTHAQAAAALTFGRTYETVNEAAVRVEVAEARKEADVARQEAESARKEAARLAEEMEKVRVEEVESVRREREERESVERERESLREDVERLRSEIVRVGRVSSSGGDRDGGVEGKLSVASGGLEGEETEEASGVAGEGEQGFGSEREAGGGGGASVEGSASDGTEEGSIQEPTILPPGWWADLIQQRAGEAKHGAAKNLVKIKERSADVASSLAASVADGSLQRSLSKRAEEAARKVRELQDADLKEGARMVREQVGGEVARRIEGVREVGERMVSMGREEAGRMVRVGRGVMDRGVREIREKAGYRWAAGKGGSKGSVGSAAAAAAAAAGVKKHVVEMGTACLLSAALTHRPITTTPSPVCSAAPLAAAAAAAPTAPFSFTQLYLSPLSSLELRLELFLLPHFLTSLTPSPADPAAVGQNVVRLPSPSTLSAPHFPGTFENSQKLPASPFPQAPRAPFHFLVSSHPIIFCLPLSPLPRTLFSRSPPYPALFVVEGVLLAEKDFNLPKHPELSASFLDHLTPFISCLPLFVTTPALQAPPFPHPFPTEGVLFAEKDFNLPKHPSSQPLQGVLFAEKDFNLPKHPELEVPNLQYYPQPPHPRFPHQLPRPPLPPRHPKFPHPFSAPPALPSSPQVIKLMQSFKSKGFVRETFAWRHYYWYLTNEGIEHLRDYLNLPSEIVPATLKKSSRPPGRPMGAGGDRPPRRFEVDGAMGTARDTAGWLAAVALAVELGGMVVATYGSAPGAPGAPPPAV
ncbi:unnamed protein product, partial [Closterium sp. Naga37s-1]